MSEEAIEHRRGAVGKSAYLGKTRVRVSDVARLYETVLMESVTGRILEAIPHLTEEQVLAALRYWKAHPEEIEAEIKRDEAALTSLQQAV